MAATLTYATGAFDPFTRDQASMFKKLALAFLGIGTAAERHTAQAEYPGRQRHRGQGSSGADGATTRGSCASPG